MKRQRKLILLIATVAFMLLASAALGILILFPVPHWGAAAQSPLHSAVLADDLPKVKSLLPRAPPGSADAELFYARSAPMAEFLISAGASVKARAHGNYTPLHFAASIGADEVVAVLLHHGAEVDAVDDAKVTALMLTMNGGDPDEGFEFQGFEKTRARRLAVTQILLNAGAKVDLHDSSNMTALGRAAQSGNSIDVVRVLVEAGANINVRSVDNITPLHGAAFAGSLETVRFLVEHGADVTVKEWQGKRPIDCIQGSGLEADEMRKLLTK